MLTEVCVRGMLDTVNSCTWCLHGFELPAAVEALQPLLPPAVHVRDCSALSCVKLALNDFSALQALKSVQLDIINIEQTVLFTGT